MHSRSRLCVAALVAVVVIVVVTMRTEPKLWIHRPPSQQQLVNNTSVASSAFQGGADTSRNSNLAVLKPSPLTLNPKH